MKLFGRVSIVIMLMLSFLLTSCGNNSVDNVEENISSENEESKEVISDVTDDLLTESDIISESVEDINTTKTEYVSIDGIYIDDSYENEDNKNVKLVYLFYTATSPDENYKVDSKSATITINESNTYDSTHIPLSCKYMGSYYYSDYLTDVYVGDQVKVVETFIIPKGDLEAGRTIKIEKSQIPTMSDISLKTDDIIVMGNDKKIAKDVDPIGYKKEKKAHEAADEETASKVKSELNGYRWDFYVNSTSYRIEFVSPNKYYLTTSLASTEGTYSVKKGYVIITNSSTGAISEIPYSFDGDTFNLDITDGFDVSNH